MIDVPAQDLAIIQTILKKHAPGCEVRVFGSRISGTAKPWSDLDLALVGKGKLPLQTIGDLRENFQESDLPFRVDMLDWHAISPEFRAVIEKHFEILPNAL